jgi:hypothetical protein
MQLTFHSTYGTDLRVCETQYFTFREKYKLHIFEKILENYVYLMRDEVHTSE